jgi:hypothetical protein
VYSGFTSGGFFKEVTSVKDNDLLYFPLYPKGKEERKIFLFKTLVMRQKHKDSKRENSESNVTYSAV